MRGLAVQTEEEALDERQLVSPALPQVLFVGDFTFPEGSAAANLLLAHAQALKGFGLSVGFLPGQGLERFDDFRSKAPRTYCGLPYWVIRRRRSRSKLVSMLQSHLNLDDQRPAWLRANNLRGVKAVIGYCGVYGGTAQLWRLRRLCAQRGVAFLNCVVEWHDPRHYRRGFLDPGALDGELRMRWLNLRLGGIICISKFLEQFYTERGCRTVLIPPLVNLKDPIWHELFSQNSIVGKPTVRLLFSGSFKRDRHDVLLRAIIRARREGLPVVLEYAGCNADELCEQCDVARELVVAAGEGVKFHGRLGVKEARQLASQCTFGVILREDRRWSRACFPSKVPEFLALGVPIFGNLTSDLQYYLKDGWDSIIVQAVSSDAVCAGMRRIASLDSSAFQALRANARHTAQRFDAANYSSNYGSFVTGTSKRMSFGPSLS